MDFFLRSFQSVFFVYWLNSKYCVEWIYKCRWWSNIKENINKKQDDLEDNKFDDEDCQIYTENPHTHTHAKTLHIYPPNKSPNYSRRPPETSNFPFLSMIQPKIWNLIFCRNNFSLKSVCNRNRPILKSLWSEERFAGIFTARDNRIEVN